ncbi:hypothetical protein [Nocardioides lijunqiniae]|uniref:hypothetical protein n=1 Tax=Nocardioides lijunqiniae TaxID=2760832 RepID=UPI001878B606|nr:hypothetical protein [Nocardioides lijunqiniae]
MTRTAPRSAVRRTLAAATALASLAVLGLASGCSSASPPSPPAGVDELTVPTPSPDPDDFVADVDNPWLTLEPGVSTTYETATGELVTTVDGGPEILGVATTAVTGETTDYYAQDEAGNVWWLGREGEWRAGEDGAEAGIAMLATPRVGDGYAQAEPGPRATVLALDGEAQTPAGDFEDLVVVETTEEAGRVLTSYYARGAGLVHRETETGAPDGTLSLVE